jgi:hypothetical protein
MFASFELSRTGARADKAERPDRNDPMATTRHSRDSTSTTPVNVPGDLNAGPAPNVGHPDRTYRANDRFLHT